VKPSVSVVIPAYNSADTIAETVQACLNQDYPAVEVIIIDDGSTDDTGKIVRQYPVRYARQENSGPAAARNTGWKQAHGEIICFTDSDCVPEPTWVSKLVSMLADERVGGAGGSYSIRNPQNLLAACVHEEITQRHLCIPRQVDYLGGFNVCYRRTVLEAVGGFDQGYRTASAEDNDLSYRVKKQGYELLFDADARVAHLYPTRLIRYLRRQAEHGYWTMRLYRTHPDMATGDAYARLVDHIEPPLFLITIGLIPLGFIRPVLYVLLGLGGANLALQFPMAVSIVRRTGVVKYLALVPITFLRGFARAIGMLAGIVRFWLLRG
jgi:cellulose synthase/poly-beta-1,6-N-acetylglucosamine synthase-like glycosyltransferase